MKELWKDVVGYEGLYQVSNEGRVRSVTRERLVKEKDRGRTYTATVKGQYIKPSDCGNYLRVFLSKDNIKKPFLVHRLVAIAFIPNPYNLPQVNHKDENKLNNNVCNLEWVTAKQNMNYGTLPKRRKEFRTRATPVLQYDLDRNLIAEYNSVIEASKMTGIPKGTIETVITRRTSTRGYFWERKHQKVTRRKK